MYHLSFDKCELVLLHKLWVKSHWKWRVEEGEWKWKLRDINKKLFGIALYDSEKEIFAHQRLCLQVKSVHMIIIVMESAALHCHCRAWNDNGYGKFRHASFLRALKLKALCERFNINDERFFSKYDCRAKAHTSLSSLSYFIALKELSSNPLFSIIQRTTLCAMADKSLFSDYLSNQSLATSSRKNNSGVWLKFLWRANWFRED